MEINTGATAATYSAGKDRELKSIWSLPLKRVLAAAIGLVWLGTSGLAACGEPSNRGAMNPPPRGLLAGSVEAETPNGLMSIGAGLAVLYSSRSTTSPNGSLGYPRGPGNVTITSISGVFAARVAAGTYNVWVVPVGLPPDGQQIEETYQLVPGASPIPVACPDCHGASGGSLPHLLMPAVNVLPGETTNVIIRLLLAPGPV